VQMVSPYTGELIDFSGEQQWLGPGQGLLLKPTAQPRRSGKF